MHFVWCESVGNILRDKTLLRERLSDCVEGSVSLFCVHPFSLINMVHFEKKFPCLILVQREQVEMIHCE